MGLHESKRSWVVAFVLIVLVSMQTSAREPGEGGGASAATVWSRATSVEPYGSKNFGWEERGKEFHNSYIAFPNEIRNTRWFKERQREGLATLKHVEFEFQLIDVPPAHLKPGDEFKVTVDGTATHRVGPKQFAESAELRFWGEDIGFPNKALRMTSANLKDQLTFTWKMPATAPQEFAIHAQMGHARIIWRYTGKKVGADRNHTNTIPPHFGTLPGGDPQRRVAMFVGVIGPVEVKAPGTNEWRPAERGMYVTVGHVIRTGGRGRARVQFYDEEISPLNASRWVINIGHNTEFVVANYANELSRFPPYASEWIKAKIHVKEHGRFWGPIQIIRGKIRGFARHWGRRHAFTVRNGIHIVGIRGSDVLMSFDPESRRLEIDVREGDVVVGNIKTRETIELAAGDKVSVEKERVGAVEPLMQEDWDRRIEQAGVELDMPLARVASLNANAHGIQFYENSTGGDLGSAWVASSFPQSTTRYVNWKLDLRFPHPARQTEYQIDAVWKTRNGSVIKRTSTSASIATGALSAHPLSGIGWNEPGNWKPGRYVVELSIAGEIVGIGSFVITDEAPRHND